MIVTPTVPTMPSFTKMHHLSSELALLLGPIGFSGKHMNTCSHHEFVQYLDGYSELS